MKFTFEVDDALITALSKRLEDRCRRLVHSDKDKLPDGAKLGDPAETPAAHVQRALAGILEDEVYAAERHAAQAEIDAAKKAGDDVALSAALLKAHKLAHRGLPKR